MKRRQFLVAVPALCSALGAHAQQPGKVYRVGFIITTSPTSEMEGETHPAVGGFLREMRRLGYAEGKNLILDRRSAEGKYERFGEIVAELLKRKPDALITNSVPLTLAAKKLTSSVPIVFMMADAGDPVAAGIVPSLARPGGNITGLLSNPGAGIFGKRVNLLKEAVPRVSSIAFLGLAAERASEARSAEAAAKELGLSFYFAEARVNDYSTAFEEIKRKHVQGLVVGAHPAHYANRVAIAEFATRNRLADMHVYISGVEAGGLMAYGTATDWSQGAAYIDRIFKGTKPGDLPVQQPTLFPLVINLKAARARGLTISPRVLERADRVIQ